MVPWTNHDGVADTGAKVYSLSVLAASSNLTTCGDTVSLHVISPTEIQGWNSHGDVVFGLSINSSTGDTTLTQFRAVVQDTPSVDTPDTSEGVFLGDNLISVTLTLTDGDGDVSSATANLNHVVEFLDDGPTANGDVDSTGITNTATGNVITGVDIAGGDANITDGNPDVVGSDGAKITQILGQDAATFDSGTHTFHVDGLFGSLAINEDGDYTYTRSSAGSGINSFFYTLTDGDGDTSTTQLTINLDSQITPLQQSSTFSGTVEEEELGNTASPPTYASSFTGNEDTNNDSDTALNSHITTNVALGQDTVIGGTGPYTYHFAALGIEGTQAQFTGGAGAITSQGHDVVLHVNGDTLTGYTEVGGGTGYQEGVDHVVFTFQIDDATTGSATFTLYDNIDHNAGGQSGDNVEGTLALDLNGLVRGHRQQPVAADPVAQRLGQHHRRHPGRQRRNDDREHGLGPDDERGPRARLLAEHGRHRAQHGWQDASRADEGSRS